jgi:hypothetical protein
MQILVTVIGTKELYEAMENMYHNAIDDYNTPEVGLTFVMHVVRSSSGK